MMQQRETPNEQHVILDGFYRWTDIKYGWPSVLTPTAAGAIKSLTSLEALLDHEHPLRERESQGITLNLGVLPGKKGPRLLFSLKQIEYLSYWIAATGYGASANDAHPIVPIPSSHSVILPEQLLEVHAVTARNAEQLKVASKKPQTALRALLDGWFEDIDEGFAPITQPLRPTLDAPAVTKALEYKSESAVQAQSIPNLPKNGPAALLWHVREAYAMASMDPEVDDHGRKIGKACFVSFLVDMDGMGSVNAVGWAAVWWRDGAMQNKQGYWITTPEARPSITYLFGPTRCLLPKDITGCTQELLRDLLKEVDADGDAVIYLLHHSAHQGLDALKAIGMPTDTISSDLASSGLPSYLNADANGQVFAIDTTIVLAAEVGGDNSPATMSIRYLAERMGCLSAGDGVWGHCGNEAYVLLQSFLLLASCDHTQAVIAAGHQDSTVTTLQARPWWDQELEEDFALEELDIGLGGPEDDDED